MDRLHGTRQKILIVDDSEMNRAILADMLGEEYEIVEAENGEKAVALLWQQSPSVSLVLLDIVMPRMDGFDVLVMMNKYHWIEDIPVIMISAENSPASVERAYELGVTDFISRPFDALIVRRRVVNTLVLYAKQKRLIDMVADQMYEKQKSNSLMVSILSHIVEFRNGESGLHVLHINTMTEILLKQLAQMTDKYHLPTSEINLISMASTLHDIGKIAVPEEILNKPGRLTDEEFEVMKSHTVIGAKMLRELHQYQDEPLVRLAYQICRWHHERYDGKGYPDGLVGENIPLAAQVVALADVYDALTSKRVYKSAYSHEKAMEMILEGACGAFSPLLLECLKAAADTIQNELKVDSLKGSSEREMRKIAEEMMHHEELSVSERTLRLLEHERMKYQFFASMSNEIQFEISKDPAILTLTDWGAEQTGLDTVILDPLHNERFHEVISAEHVHNVSRALRDSDPENPIIQYECPLDMKGEKRWYRLVCRAFWTTDDPPQYTGAIGKAIDISLERDRLIDLQRRASHDGLTGLLNQGSVRREVEQRLIESPDRKYAMFMFDVDHLKEANDRYGHVFGDKLIRCVAERLRDAIRKDDIAARVGGDEFLVFLDYKGDPEGVARRIFQSLKGTIQTPRINGQTGDPELFQVSVSMGIALAENAGYDYEKLFSQADHALYACKRRGRDQYCFYDDSMSDMFSVISEIDGGDKALEQPAGEFLRSRGMTILEYQYSGPISKLQIDLVAQDGRSLVLAEVKRREWKNYLDQSTWSSRYKDMIRQDAEAYLRIHHMEPDTPVWFELIHYDGRGEPLRTVWKERIL